ncbi:MAG TPA: hypothetical protein VGL47_03370 [Amycolatopsis sp.]|uniref:Uncharacterized protein n=1 Tax=Amycolatopsis nalaikhensis TaxID=715472 RepID=A0ABY8XNX5_9PSEU|nr:hypothetical protein [Amycolatopsis sp. 2-2]WIV57375.1 hypothetical protein QP939_01365 [Amycolatopsis sp. 2-2]
MELTIGGAAYPVRQDFADFGADVLDSRIAVLATPFDAVSALDHVERLWDVLKRRLDENTAFAAAAEGTELWCLSCGFRYSYQVLQLRDLAREGRRVGGTAANQGRTEEILSMSSACVECGGREAAWVHFPPGTRPPEPTSPAPGKNTKVVLAIASAIVLVAVVLVIVLVA